jgi:glycosyltransferase involved in cell wall biosynthesis
MKRRVLILQDHLRGGGTERQSIRLCRALLDHDWEATLLVGAQGGRLDALAQEELAQHLHFCYPTPTLLSSLRALRQVRQHAANQASVLIAMGRWANCLLNCCRLGHDCRSIATVRTSRPLPYLYRRSIRQADAVLANSHWALQSALRSSRRPEDGTTAVIHNALSRPELLQIDPSDKAAAKRAIGLPPDNKLLLSVARMDHGKGQADLLRLMALPSAHNRKLVLLGEGPESKRLRALAHSLNIAHTVIFAGFCEHSRPYYAAADLFLSASALDSLPNALIEAQAAALPTLAYPTAGIPEIVDDRETGHLIAHGDIATMHRQVEVLLNQPSKITEMGRAARQSAIERFAPRQQIEASIQFIAAL